ncbi:MAG: hypothetical protein ACLVFU_02010 [Eggerthellaceae bacterium]|jgi:hypothetical protein
MLITASEYSSMGFPAVSGGDVESCIKRSGYIISALTEGRAEKSVEAGGKPAELVKQAAGFQTYILLRENERYEKSSHSGSDKVSIGDYSYSTQSSESSDSGSTASDDENSLNVIRLLRAAGCLYAGVEVLE